MKAEQNRGKNDGVQTVVFPLPSSFILYPSSFILSACLTCRANRASIGFTSPIFRNAILNPLSRRLFPWNSKTSKSSST
jgi:hypothetical protein